MRVRLTAASAALAIALSLVGALPVFAFSYDDYAQMLNTHVNDKGMVSYAKLKANPADLKAFLDKMARLDRAAFDDWPEKDRIASRSPTIWTRSWPPDRNGSPPP